MNITITETSNGTSNTVKVKKAFTRYQNQRGKLLGLTELQHDGDGEDLVITEAQYNLLLRAKELTITAGNIVTYYLQCHG